MPAVRPTAALDLDAREALEDALSAFGGAVLLVSHDRALLDAVPTRIVAIEDRTLRSYDGAWADLERERSAKAAAPTPAATTTPKPKPKPGRPARERPAAPSELAQLESTIEAVETRVAQLEAKLAEDWADMDALAAHRAARGELRQLLARWEALFEESTTR